MNNIEIRIPDNLTPEKELLEIAKALSKKMLNPSSTKLIGNGKNDFEIKDLSTNIKITRFTKEKVFKTDECNICQAVFIKSKGVPVFNNYGGIVRRKLVCSDSCADIYLDLVGQRSSKTRKGIYNVIY